MNLSLETGVPVFTVLLQGLFSFFSPCVFPLLPVYAGYLAGGTQTRDENGQICYPRKKIFVNTLFFVIGISFAFFLLGMGFSAFGQFFSGNRVWFARVSGMIMIIFGLYQLGVFGKSAVMERERRIPFRLEKLSMNPVTALVLGFTFSFAWTPCVGPTLTSVLLMASSAQSKLNGLVLIGVYVLGFVIPFLCIGIFTGSILRLFRRYRNVIKYTVKAGAVLLIFMGIMTLTGWMNGLTGYLSSYTSQRGENKTQTGAVSGSQAGEKGAEKEEEEKVKEKTEKETVAAPDFQLTDQYGNQHTLSDYKGKTVFLNFWATWCGPCRQEMPDIQKLYEEYGSNEKDLVVLGIANPRTEEYPHSSDVETEEIIQFLSENAYEYPVLMDASGNVFSEYGISAFPVTFMIDTEGNVFGYVKGTLTKDMMERIVQQTMSGEKNSQ